MTPTAAEVAVARRQRLQLERFWAEAARRRYARDPLAFFEECIYIPAPNEQGRQLFELYDYQRDDLETFQSEHHIVVLKARQLGLTTLSMAYALWKLLFRPGTNALLVSKDQRTADQALELMDFMWRFIPEWLRPAMPTLEGDSAREHVWAFDSGLKSYISSLPATKTVGAGATVDLVLWDEAALAEYQDDTLRTLLPTIEVRNGTIIVFSTARGGHNRFARLYREAQRGGRWVPVFHPWFLSRTMNPNAHRVRTCPRGVCRYCVDKTKYHAAKKDFDEEPWRFYAEHPKDPDEAFRQSGRSRFGNLPPEEEFEEYPFRGRLVEDDRGVFRLVPDEDGPLRVRTDLLDRHGRVPRDVKTVLSVDPATGEGGDYTAMTLGWLDDDGTPQRVAFWHSNLVEPVDAAQDADRLGRWARGERRAAKLAVEKQGGYGDSIIHELRANLRYPNMYVHRYTGHRKRKRETTYGFPMNQNRRPLVIDRLAQWVPREGFPGDFIEGIDPLLRLELGAFVVRDDGKVAADAGMHDDLVMSTGIWLYVLTEEVGPATAVPTDEKPDDGVVQHSLSYVWDEVARAEQREQKRRRREAAQFRRKMRRR